jgi:alanyl-tRNA synthetase
MFKRGFGSILRVISKNQIKPFYFIFLGVLGCGASTLDKDRVICSRSIEKYLMRNYGDQYKEDENIVIEKIPETPFVWVIDKTSKVNPDRKILEQKKNEVCIVLHSPISNSILFKLKEGHGLPRNISTETARTNGFPVIKIHYVKDKTENLYKRESCKTKTSTKKSVRVDCNKLFFDLP